MKLRHEITPEQLEQFACEYILECLNNKKEVATPSGKVVLIKDRRLPTLQYFLKIWLPLNRKPTLCRSTYYFWLKCEDESVMDTMKQIHEMFDSLAIDVLANDNKGAGAIFYAKNRLNFSDQQTIEAKEQFKPLELIVKYSDDIKPIE